MSEEATVIQKTNEELPETPPETNGKISQRVQQYIAVREKRRALKKAYQDEDAPLIEGENLLSGAILRLLSDAGIENARTIYGTCFKTTKTTTSLADPDAFMNFVVHHGMFELLDRKANATAVRAYAEEHKELPPGVTLNSFTTIGVHKKVGVD